jgi:hypothetical protein
MCGQSTCHTAVRAHCSNVGCDKSPEPVAAFVKDLTPKYGFRIGALVILDRGVMRMRLCGGFNAQEIIDE